MEGEAETWRGVCEAEDCVLPTVAFCRALEREAAYDEREQLATGEGGAPPPLNTALLEEHEEALPEKQTLRRTGFTLYVLDEELSVPGRKRSREEEEEEARPAKETRRAAQ